MKPRLKDREIENLTSAGVGRNLTLALAKTFPPPVIIGHIQRLLDATVGGKPGPDGEIQGARPDAHSVRAGLTLLLGYLVGEPVKRIAVADATPKESDEDTLARLAASPAAMRALAATLSEMPGGREAMDSALRTAGKTMEAVEVPVE